MRQKLRQACRCCRVIDASVSPIVSAALNSAGAMENFTDDTLRALGRYPNGPPRRGHRQRVPINSDLNSYTAAMVERAEALGGVFHHRDPPFPATPIRTTAAVRRPVLRLMHPCVVRCAMLAR
jgi:hypothetical protein